MLRIDLYMEITCPWCLIGQYRLDKVLKGNFSDLTVDIQHHPILLMPSTPPAGVYIPDLLRQRYGITDFKAAFARPEADARQSGLNLNLERQLYAYSTIPAHALIAAAGNRGTQHQLAYAIKSAYFLDAKNISDLDVLASIATGFGFGKREAIELAQDPDLKKGVENASLESAAAGIRAVPHFVFNHRTGISGGRTEQEIASAIEHALLAA
ncbi:DsbA family protein [Xanthomonas citri]|nr:DsbA family protein [Xanthomonas citri]QQK70065.1 DsbA family protein [Xanthomonas citri]